MRRLGTFALACFLALSGSSCLNNVTSVVNEGSSTSGSLSNLGSVESGGTASDGATGQCLLYDKSNPDRLTCVDCYKNILASRCPGKTKPDQCLDPVVRSGFQNLVNSCITDTILNGVNCSRTVCPAGFVVSNTCTCVPAGVGGSSGGGGGGGGANERTDIGLQNSGPPVVTLLWNSNLGVMTPAGVGISGPTGPLCHNAKNDIEFLVVNRGDTVTRLNSARVVSVNCPTSYAAASDIQATAPVRATGSNSMLASIRTQTLGWSDPKYIYYNDFEKGDPTTWTDPSRPSARLANGTVGAVTRGTYAPNFGGSNMGPYRQTNAGGPRLQTNGTIFANPAKKNVLAFDLLILDTWLGTGTTPPDPLYKFKINITAAGGINYGLFDLIYGDGNNDGIIGDGNGTDFPDGFGFTNGAPPEIPGQGYQDYPGTRLGIGEFNAIAGSGVRDSVYHIQLPVSGATDLAVTLSDTIGAQNGTWAIDNLALYPPASFQSCGIKYAFTDSAQQTSNYCFRFQIVTTGDKCYLSPLSRPDSATFYLLRSPDEVCGDP